MGRILRSSQGLVKPEFVFRNWYPSLSSGRVRKGDSARTGPCRIGTCTAERETSGTTANSGAESRSSSGLYPAGTSKAEDATQNSAHGVRNPSGEDLSYSGMGLGDPTPELGKLGEELSAEGSPWRLSLEHCKH